MNSKEIIRIADETGLDLRMKDGNIRVYSRKTGVWIDVSGLVREVTALATLKERQRCLECYSPDDTAQDWADKIRKG